MRPRSPTQTSTRSTIRCPAHCPPPGRKAIEAGKVRAARKARRLDARPSRRAKYVLRESPWRPTRRRHRPSQRRRGPPRSGYGGAGLRAVVMATRASAQWLWRRGPPRSGYGDAGLRAVVMAARASAQWLWRRGPPRSGYGGAGLRAVVMAARASAQWLWRRGPPRSGYGGAGLRAVVMAARASAQWLWKRSTIATSSGTVRRGGLRGEPFPASAADAVVKVRLTGDVYRAAGLPPCGR